MTSISERGEGNMESFKLNDPRLEDVLVAQIGLGKGNDKLLYKTGLFPEEKQFMLEYIDKLKAFLVYNKILLPDESARPDELMSSMTLGGFVNAVNRNQNNLPNSFLISKNDDETQKGIIKWSKGMLLGYNISRVQDIPLSNSDEKIVCKLRATLKQAA